MARSAPGYSSGTIAAQASATDTLDLFIPVIETALASFDSNGGDAWELYDDVDSALASRDRVYRSLGDRTLVSGAGDTWLFARVERTTTSSLLLTTYQDWSTDTSTGSRQSTNLTFSVTNSELNYFVSLNEYEFHCVFEQSGSWRWFGWASPVRTHVPPAHRGVALATGAITAGTSVVIPLDRDISNTIQVGAPVWVQNRTATGDALEASDIEIVEVEAVTGTPNITLTLSNNYASGALIGADPAALAVWTATGGAPTLRWTHDAAGVYQGVNGVNGSVAPLLENTDEAGADPGPSGYYLGCRANFRINTAANVADTATRGTSDVVAFWADGAQASPLVDTMTDVETGNTYKTTDLNNINWLLCLQQ